MKRRVPAVLVVSVVTLAIVTAAAARERSLKRSELPAAVRAAADEQSQGATVRGYSVDVEGGQKEYEVAMTVNGHSRDVTISPEGKVLEVEEQVQLAELPSQVREALVSKAGAGRIVKVESLTKAGRVVAYEAQVRGAKGKRSEIQVGPDGAPLAHPE